ncbi:MAG: hypothetical protein ABJK35_00520, partial [Balneola sp.]
PEHSTTKRAKAPYFLPHTGLTFCCTTKCTKPCTVLFEERTKLKSGKGDGNDFDTLGKSGLKRFMG